MLLSTCSSVLPKKLSLTSNKLLKNVLLEDMAVLLDKLSREGPISLETYGHQVGGHHLLFKFEDTLCKPVNERERFFYVTAPDEIKRYIPGYFGVINVCYEKTSSGEIKVLATRKEEQPKPHPPGITVEMTQLPKCTTGHTIHNDDVTLVTTTNGEEEEFKNPWASMCSKIMDRKLSEMGGDLSDISVDYMILENLTSKFTSPSVLDLKVGTRQHGDDSTPSKVAKHMHSCAMSTSSSLGVRMAGLQKFDQTKKEYVFIDKYFGRQITAEEFAQVLTYFLFNGSCFRHDLIPSIIKMLQDLRESVKNLSSFRYFSSSLLLIYDGAECPHGLDERSSSKVRDIEEKIYKILARTKTADEQDVLSNGRAELNGVDSRLTMSSTDTSYLEINSDRSELVTESKSERNHVAAAPGENHLSSLSAPSLGCSNCSRLAREDLSKIRTDVDLRMIDFAHSTHSGFSNDPVTYKGPDESYLTGLDSLILIFQEMQSIHR